MTASRVSDGTSETDTRLLRFIHHDRDRIEACAGIAPRVAQLAVSFPLLFAALASSYGPHKPRVDAIAAAVNGATLRQIADIIGIPYCFRLLPPETCPRKLFHHHWSPGTNRRLRPLVPLAHHAIYPWLSTLFVVARRSDEDIAIWMAREQCLLLLGRVHPDALQPLLMFAWYSTHYPDIVARNGKWTPDINLRNALQRCELWLKHLALFSDFDAKGVVDPWLPEVQSRDMHIVPLTTPGAILEEATTMQNCLVDYAEYVADGMCRLFSVRIDGRRVATLRLNPCAHRQTLIIAEIKGPKNRPCPRDIVRHVNKIVSAYQPRHLSTHLRRPFSKHDNLMRNLGPYCNAMPTSEQPRLEKLTIDRLWADYHHLSRLVRIWRRAGSQ